MNNSDFNSLVNTEVTLKNKAGDLCVTGLLVRSDVSFSVNNSAFRAKDAYCVFFPPHVMQGIIFIR